MLMRILTDNPGRNFTQNFDKDFVSTVKRLLRDMRDSSVQQILRETLDHFEAEKVGANDTLIPLLEMWRKEKGSAARIYQNPGVSYTQVIFMISTDTDRLLDTDRHNLLIDREPYLLQTNLPHESKKLRPRHDCLRRRCNPLMQVS